MKAQLIKNGDNLELVFYYIDNEGRRWVADPIEPNFTNVDAEAVIQPTLALQGQASLVESLVDELNEMGEIHVDKTRMYQLEMQCKVAEQSRDFLQNTLQELVRSIANK